MGCASRCSRFISSVSTGIAYAIRHAESPALITYFVVACKSFFVHFNAACHARASIRNSPIRDIMMRLHTYDRTAFVWLLFDRRDRASSVVHSDTGSQSCCLATGKSRSTSHMHVRTALAVPECRARICVKCNRSPRSLPGGCSAIIGHCSGVSVVAIVLIVPFICARAIFQYHIVRQTRFSSHGSTLHSIHGMSHLAVDLFASCCLQLLDRDYETQPHLCNA